MAGHGRTSASKNVATRARVVVDFALNKSDTGEGKAYGREGRTWLLGGPVKRRQQSGLLLEHRWEAAPKIASR